MLENIVVTKNDLDISFKQTISLNYKHKELFSSVESFMLLWCTFRNKDWFQVKVGSIISLGESKNRTYVVIELDLFKDHIVLAWHDKTNQPFPSRIISNIPYMKLIRL